MVYGSSEFNDFLQYEIVYGIIWQRVPIHHLLILNPGHYKIANVYFQQNAFLIRLCVIEAELIASRRLLEKSFRHHTLHTNDFNLFNNAKSQFSSQYHGNIMDIFILAIVINAENIKKI